MRNGEAATTQAWERKVRTYNAMLADIDDKTLEAAFVTIAREPGRIHFPTTGEIRGIVEKARLEEIATAVDAAWKAIHAYMARWGCPAKAQTIVRAGKMETQEPPEIDALTLYAITACGGYETLYNTEISNANWARTRFVEAYGRMAEQSTRALLTAGEARKAIAQISEAGNDARRSIEAKRKTAQ